MGSSSSKNTIQEGDKMVEVTAGNVDDFKDGDMREVDLGERKALLVKDKGNFYAVSAKCTHYAAPLVKGVVCDGKVRCPWHGACFSLKTGDLEDFPGLDSLHKFEVSTEGGQVKIKAKESQLKGFKRTPDMVTGSCQGPRVVIVGGGPASVACAEALRQKGFKGAITIFTREKYLPYDRPKLSKAKISDVTSIQLRPAEFFKKHNIDIQLQKEAASVDTKGKTVKFADGSEAKYDKLLIATGGSPSRPPNCPESLCRILRDPDDARAISEEANGKHVIAIGTSFIGMELASLLKGGAASVHVIGRHDAPFHRFLGDKVGAIVKEMVEKKGLQFCPNTEVEEFVSEGGKLTGVKLKGGQELPADLAVAGVGVRPSTGFLKDSGIAMNDRGFVTVNKMMETNVADVYAAGDICEFPLFLEGDKHCNVQHWPMAHMQGRTAGLHIAGKGQEIRSVPYFWSVVFGKSIRYCGYAPKYDEVIVHHPEDEEKFAAFFIKDGRVGAAASLAYDPLISQLADVLLAGHKVPADTVREDPLGFLPLLGKPPK